VALSRACSLFLTSRALQPAVWRPSSKREAASAAPISARSAAESTSAMVMIIHFHPVDSAAVADH
jgi:hypothetical protein